MGACGSCGRVDGQHGMNCGRVDSGCEEHIQQIREAFCRDLERKYRAGQLEHGGRMWEKGGMLDCAIDEVVDLVAYLYTLRQQLEKLSGHVLE